jgi:hypothetical protein
VINPRLLDSKSNNVALNSYDANLGSGHRKVENWALDKHVDTGYTQSISCSQNCRRLVCFVATAIGPRCSAGPVQAVAWDFEDTLYRGIDSRITSYFKDHRVSWTSPKWDWLYSRSHVRHLSHAPQRFVKCFQPWPSCSTFLANSNNLSRSSRRPTAQHGHHCYPPQGYFKTRTGD